MDQPAGREHEGELALLVVAAEPARVGGRARVLFHQVDERLPGEVVGGAAEQLGELAVGEDDPPLGIEQRDALGGGLDDQPVLLLAFAERVGLLGELPVARLQRPHHAAQDREERDVQDQQRGDDHACPHERLVADRLRDRCVVTVDADHAVRARVLVEVPVDGRVRVQHGRVVADPAAQLRGSVHLGAGHRLAHLGEVVRHLSDQRVVGRVRDHAGAREERHADDAARERDPAEELVEVGADARPDRRLQGDLGEIVAGELVGGVVRIRPDVLLGADAGVVGRKPGSGRRRDEEGDAGVEPEAEEEPGRLRRRDRGQRGVRVEHVGHAACAAAGRAGGAQARMCSCP